MNHFNNTFSNIADNKDITPNTTALAISYCFLLYSFGVCMLFASEVVAFDCCAKEPNKL